MMRGVLALTVLGSWMLGSVTAADAQLQDSGSSRDSLEVLVPAKRVEAIRDQLDAVLSSGRYDYKADAVLSTALAAALAGDKDLDGAEGQLRATLDRMDAAGQGKTYEAAVVNDALATVHKLKGEVDAHLRRRMTTYEIMKDSLGRNAEPTLISQVRVAEAFELDAATEYGGGIDSFQNAVRLARDARKRAIREHGEEAMPSLFASLARARHLFALRMDSKAEKILESFETLSNEEPFHADFQVAAKAAAYTGYQRRGRDADAEAAKRELTLIAEQNGLARELFDPVADRLQRRIQNAGQNIQGGDVFSSFNDGSPPPTSIDLRPMSLAGRWAEVSYCVDASGQAQNFRLLDAKGGPNWEKMVEDMVMEKDFLPGVINDEAVECAPRMERISILAPRQLFTGSRIKQLSPQFYVQVQDLYETRSLTAFSVLPSSSEDGDG